MESNLKDVHHMLLEFYGNEYSNYQAVHDVIRHQITNFIKIFKEPYGNINIQLKNEIDDHYENLSMKFYVMMNLRKLSKYISNVLFNE